MSAFVPSSGRLAVLSRASSLLAPALCPLATAFSTLPATFRPHVPNRSHAPCVVVISMQQHLDDADEQPDLDFDDDDDDMDAGNTIDDRRSGGGGRTTGGRDRGSSTDQVFEDAKLFIGNLSWETTDSSLGAAFAEFGEVVDSKVVTDKFTGKSRGFGFITFADPSAASSALESMNGQQVDGRTIRIDRANKRVGGPGPRGGGGQSPRRNYY